MKQPPVKEFSKIEFLERARKRRDSQSLKRKIVTPDPPKRRPKRFAQVYSVSLPPQTAEFLRCLTVEKRGDQPSLSGGIRIAAEIARKSLKFDSIGEETE